MSFSDKQKEILMADFQTKEIIKADIKNINKNPILYQNAPVKMQTGRIYTDKEYEKYRKKVLNLKLPSENKTFIKKLKKN